MAVAEKTRFFEKDLGMATTKEESRSRAVASSSPTHQEQFSGLQDQKTSAIVQPQGQQTPSNPGPKVQPGGNNVIGVHYKIGRKIGEGSFGIIYEGTANLFRIKPPQ